MHIISYRMLQMVQHNYLETVQLNLDIHHATIPVRLYQEHLLCHLFQMIIHHHFELYMETMQLLYLKNKKKTKEI